jgi:hypothetical protein
VKDESKPIKIKKVVKPEILESVRSNRIFNFLNALSGCKAEKRTERGYGRKGGADILGCINGWHFEFEVKRPKIVLTDLQMIRQREWAIAGAIIGRVECVEDVKKIFEEYGIII